MPPRLDPTPEQALRKLLERREQSRVGMARLRAQRRDSVSKPVSKHETVSKPVSKHPPVPPASPSPDPTLSTPPKSPPKGNVRVAAMIDALRAQGMTGTLTAKDRQALLATQADPVEVAALYAAVFRGEYGDDFMHRKLSVGQCLEWLPGWRSHQAGHHAPQRDPWARTNGHPKAASGAAAVRAVFRKAKDDAAAAVGGGRGGDGVGPGEAGPRLPRLLRD